MSKLIVEVPTDLHRALKRKAAEKGRTLKDIVTELLGDYLRGGHDQGDIVREGTGLCGVWNDERSSEEIVEDIRAHRNWSSRATRK